MSAALIGLAAGTLLGFVNFALLWVLAERIERTQPKSEAPRVLKIVAWVDLLMLPAIGYVIGPLVPL